MWSQWWPTFKTPDVPAFLDCNSDSQTIYFESPRFVTNQCQFLLLFNCVSIESVFSFSTLISRNRMDNTMRAWTLFRGSFVFKNINLTTLTCEQPTQKKTLLFIYLLAQLSIQKIFTLTFTTISINSKCNKVNLLFSFRIFKPLTFKQFVSLTFSWLNQQLCF